ncbi:MAG TPA: GYF domain-containing protein, partial [Candidatus Udaeobacter sp.]
MERLMLDSGCMMLDDQGMAEEWIVRVEGKEYGPADIETLHEWKREGRLLPENEARNASADLWSTAAAIPGLFDLAATMPIAGRPTQPPQPAQ